MPARRLRAPELRREENGSLGGGAKGIAPRRTDATGGPRRDAGAVGAPPYDFHFNSDYPRIT
jgi:hypothetical protein